MKDLFDQKSTYVNGNAAATAGVNTEFEAFSEIEFLCDFVGGLTSEEIYVLMEEGVQ